MKYTIQKPIDDFGDIDLMILNSEDNLKHLIMIDYVQDIKCEKVLYRYFTIPVADGKAYYQVTNVTKTSATVTLCEGISLDNYEYLYFGKEATISLKQAKQYIELRIASEEILRKL